MKLPLYQIDAFTSRLFGGNPAAVVLLDEWLPDDVLAAIAAENNLAETAYVIPGSDAMPLRWFTPKVEVDLCGHATLATADVLFRHRFPEREKLAFETRSGRLTVARHDDLLSMDFPSRPGKPVEVSDLLVSALGRRPREAYMARDLMAVFDTEADVSAIEPDLQRLWAVDAFAIIITAPGKSPRSPGERPPLEKGVNEVDFVSRFFSPRAGIPEDPVTGSSHCTLVPYWAQRLGKTELTARQLSRRGGELYCKLRGERVDIAGRAVEYLRGEITV